MIEIAYLYNRAYRVQKMLIKAEMHAFFENEKLDKIDFVVLPNIEDLLDEKIFLTKIVKHRDGT